MSSGRCCNSPSKFQSSTTWLVSGVSKCVHGVFTNEYIYIAPHFLHKHFIFLIIIVGFFIFLPLLFMLSIIFAFFGQLWLRSLGEENGNPLQDSCLENPMDRGSWRAKVPGFAKSWTRLNGLARTHDFYLDLLIDCHFLVDNISFSHHI